MFSAALVHKLPVADMTQGALAATVNLRTSRPLDLGNLLRISGQVSDHDLSEVTDSRGSITACRTFTDGTLGGLASARYSRRRARFDTIKGSFASFDDDIARYSLQAPMTSAPGTGKRTVVDGDVVAGTFSNILQQSENLLQAQPEKVNVISPKADWNVSPGLKLSTRIGYAQGSGSVEDSRVTYATTSAISYAIQGRAAVLTSAADLTNPAIFGHNLTIWNSGENKNEALTGRIDADYHSRWSFLSNLFDGLCILANDTYADSSIQVTLDAKSVTRRLPGQSPHAFNIVGSSEKGPVGMRVAHSWRDGYLFNIRSNSRLETQDAYGQVDLSAHSDINDNPQGTVDAITLTGEKTDLYDGQPERPRVSSDVGRSLSVGFRARF